MKATRPSRIVLALLAVTFTMGASAAAEAAEAGPSWRSKGKSRLSGSLAKAADGKSLGRHSDVKVEGGRARVELSGPDPGALIAAVEAAGGSVEVAGPGSIPGHRPHG